MKRTGCERTGKQQSSAMTAFSTCAASAEQGSFAPGSDRRTEMNIRLVSDIAVGKAVSVFVFAVVLAVLLSVIGMDVRLLALQVIGLIMMVAICIEILIRQEIFDKRVQRKIDRVKTKPEMTGS